MIQRKDYNIIASAIRNMKTVLDLTQYDRLVREFASRFSLEYENFDYNKFTDACYGENDEAHIGR